MPAVLLPVHAVSGVNAIPLTESETVIIAVILLASGSLYISSLCRSGLWALIMSMPAVVGSAALSAAQLRVVGESLVRRGEVADRETAATISALLRLRRKRWSYLLIAGVIAIALRFAFINHRSADRPAKRVWTQVIVMATFVAAGIIVGAAWQALRR